MKDLFSRVLSKIQDGMKITFTPDNVAEDDNFLLLGEKGSCTVTFHTKNVPYWLEFDNDEPMRLEDVPSSFLRSILKNV